MLVLNLEVYPGGKQRQRRKIGQAIITNDRTGDLLSGNYQAVFAHDGKPLRSAVVGFPRKDSDAWELVYRALRNYYERADPVPDEDALLQFVAPTEGA